MGSYFRDNSIGTDPTNVPVIENLDVSPKVKNEKPKKEPVKMVIFTVVVVVLMLGVAGGLYYYLNLGQKNKKSSDFTLNDISIAQGSVLSGILSDYGDFSKVDESLCQIDLSSVDVNTPGSYSYGVKCFKTNKQAIIRVIAFYDLNVTTKIINRKVGSSVEAKTFVSGDSSYTYTFVDNDDYSNLQRTGLRTVAIDVKDTNDNHQIVYGVLNVFEKDYLTMMDCKLDNVTQRIIFDNNKERMGNILHINTYIYDNKDDLTKLVMRINNGSLSIDNVSGYALVDYSKLQIRLVYAENDSNVSQSVPKTYDEIRAYYQNNNYTC